MDNKNNNNNELRKNLSPLSVWALAFGCIIGWGSFINPGKKFLPNSGVAGTAIAMALGAIVMIIIAFSYAYMVPKYPKAGGEFTFAKMCFGKNVAFVCGWFLVAAYLTNVPMNSTALGLIIDGIFGDILKFGFHYSIAGFEVYFGEMLFAMTILVLFALFSIRGVKVAGYIQTILAFCLVSSVLVLSITALLNSNVTIDNMAPIWGLKAAEATPAGADVSTQAVLSSVLATFAIAPWAFVGFDTIPQAAEEFNFSYKKVSFIMIVAIIFGGFVYISNNTVAAAALANWPELLENNKNEWLLLRAAEMMLGNFGKILVGVGVLSAVLSGIMGFYMASSRLMYSMSRDGYLPKLFGKVDPKYGTPKNAMIFCLIISLCGPILGREALGWFVDMSAIGASIGFGITALATIVTLKKNSSKSAFLHVMSILGAVFSFAFIFLQLIPVPGLESVHFGNESYIMLVAWIAIGAVFYIMQRKKFGINEDNDVN